MSKVTYYCRIREERGFRLAVPVTMFYIGNLGFVEFRDLNGRKVFVNFGGRFIDTLKVIHRQNYVPVIYAKYCRTAADHVVLGTFKVDTLTRDTVCDVLSDYEIKIYKLRRLQNAVYARESKVATRPDYPLDRYEVAKVMCILDKDLPNYCFAFLPKDLAPTHFTYVAVFGQIDIDVRRRVYLGIAVPSECEDVVLALS